jgi:hypothetical protein
MVGNPCGSCADIDVEFVHAGSETEAGLNLDCDGKL